MKKAKARDLEIKGRKIKGEPLGRKAKVSDEVLLYDLRHLWVSTQLNNGRDLGALSYMSDPLPLSIRPTPAITRTRRRENSRPVLFPLFVEMMLKDPSKRGKARQSVRSSSLNQWAVLDLNRRLSA